tara:strand:+ start:4220 stop:6805 length:2586 start_codon:yes stop_codon:yes gene_type:complete
LNPSDKEGKFCDGSTSDKIKTCDFKRYVNPVNDNLKLSFTCSELLEHDGVNENTFSKHISWKNNVDMDVSQYKNEEKDIVNEIKNNKDTYPLLYPFFTDACSSGEDTDLKSIIEERIHNHENYYTAANVKNRKLSFINNQENYIKAMKNHGACAYKNLSKTNLFQLNDFKEKIKNYTHGGITDIEKRFDKKNFTCGDVDTQQTRLRDEIEKIEIIKRKISNQNCDLNTIDSSYDTSKKDLENECYRTQRGCEYCRDIDDDIKILNNIKEIDDNITKANENNQTIYNLKNKCNEIINTKIANHMIHTKIYANYNHAFDSTFDSSSTQKKIDNYCEAKNDANFNIQENDNDVNHNPCDDNNSDDAVWGKKLNHKHRRHLSAPRDCSALVGKKSIQNMTIKEKENCFLQKDDNGDTFFDDNSQARVNNTEEGKQIVYEQELYCNYTTEKASILKFIETLNQNRIDEIKELKTQGIEKLYKQKANETTFNYTNSKEDVDAEKIICDTKSTCPPVQESVTDSIKNYIDYRENGCNSSILPNIPRIGSTFHCVWLYYDVVNITNKTSWEKAIDSSNIRRVDMKTVNDYLLLLPQLINVQSPYYDSQVNRKCLHALKETTKDNITNSYVELSIKQDRQYITDNLITMGYSNFDDFAKASKLKNQVENVIGGKIDELNGNLDKLITECEKSQCTLNKEYEYNGFDDCMFLEGKYADNTWMDNTNFGEGIIKTVRKGDHGNGDHEDTCDVIPVPHMPLNELLESWESNLTFAYGNSDGALNRQGIHNTWDLCAKYGSGKYLNIRSLHIDHPDFKSEFFNNFFSRRISMNNEEGDPEEKNDGYVPEVCPSMCSEPSNHRRMLFKLGAYNIN